MLTKLLQTCQEKSYAGRFQLIAPQTLVPNLRFCQHITHCTGCGTKFYPETYARKLWNGSSRDISCLFVNSVADMVEGYNLYSRQLSIRYYATVICRQISSYTFPRHWLGQSIHSRQTCYVLSYRQNNDTDAKNDASRVFETCVTCIQRSRPGPSQFANSHWQNQSSVGIQLNQVLEASLQQHLTRSQAWESLGWQCEG